MGVFRKDDPLRMHLSGGLRKRWLFRALAGGSRHSLLETFLACERSAQSFRIGVKQMHDTRARLRNATRQLAEELSVSRITVRKAIEGLVDEGLLVRRQGAGNFVATRVEKNFAKLTSFSEDMRARGRTPHSEWLRKSEGTVTPEEALTLRLSPGTPVYRFHRLRFADAAPMSLEYATIVACCLPSLDSVDNSLGQESGSGGLRARCASRRHHRGGAGECQGFAVDASGRARVSPLRGTGAQRGGIEEFHRFARGDPAPGCGVDRRTGAATLHGRSTGVACVSLGVGLESGIAMPATGESSVRDWPRPWSRRGAGSGIERQGNLRSACRGF